MSRRAKQSRECSRRRRDRLRAAGVCITCAGSLGRGKSECDGCLDMRSASARARQPRRNQRFHAWVALGLCGICGAEAIGSFCGRHAEQHADLVAASRARKIARGECCYCPQRAVEGRVSCQGHLDRATARARRSRDRRAPRKTLVAA